MQLPDESKYERLAALLAYVAENRRICPQPRRWNELWELLPNRRQNPNGGWSPPLPLILGAWHYASDGAKRLRLREHIQCAWQNGVFEQVDSFLRNLPDSEWYKAGGN